MMRGLAAIWLAFVPALLPAWAAAQTYRVQSGDHAGYSRLAILYRDLPEWELGRVPGGYELRPDRPTASYDLTQIFRRIGRNRIADVVERPDGRLFLAVECDCYADAFEVPQGVVIDIRQGTAPDTARFERVFPPERDVAGEGRQPDAPSVAGASQPADTPPPAPPVPAFALQTSPLRTPYAWQNELALDLSPPSEQEGTPDTGETDVVSPERADQLAEMQANLLAQISRAGAQGLVETDLDRIDEAIDATRPKPPVPEPAPVEEPPAAPETPDKANVKSLESFANIRIETAVDRGENGPTNPTPMTRDGTDCIGDDRLDLNAWGTLPAGGADLGAYRGGIVGEFDTADADGIATLTRAYLYLSFGIEARVLIEAFPADVPDKDLYIALSDIMDNGNTATPGPLRGQMACPNRAALWAVLASPALKRSDSVATKSVVAGFSELPLHLRRHLGPWLVERFLAVGDARTATALRNAIARAPGPHGEELQVIDADIALESGNGTKAEAHLEAVVAEDGSLAPEALIRLIDSQLDADRPVARKHRDNAAALAFSARGTEMGAELKRVQIRALAHAGAYKAALAELDAYRTSLTDPVTERLSLEIYTLAAEDSPQDEFLKLVLPGPVPLGQTEDADRIRRAIASRLIDLGLTEPARLLLSDDPTVPAPEDRLLYANAYLQESRPDLMIGYLAGLDTPDAMALRAKAHELAQEYARAAEAYADLNDETARSRAVWRGENWAEAAVLSTGIEQDAARLATDLPPETAADGTGDGASAGTLAESRALVAGSQETRRILEKLLSDRPAPES